MSNAKYDNIIIGAGFAGLVNAVFSAVEGKRALVIAKGAGALTIGGGLVDVLGYSTVGTILSEPFQGCGGLEEGHPYRILGQKAVEKAVASFVEICEKCGYPYLEPVGNRWIPTAAGRLSPSYLVPRTMNLSLLKNADKVYVAGIKGIKDFSSKMIADSFSSMDYFRGASFIPVTVEYKDPGPRDLSVMDVARFLDNPEERTRFMEIFRQSVPEGSAALIPPILGSRPDYTVYDSLASELGVKLCEVSVAPPSVTGYRLRSMLLGILEEFHTEIIENAVVLSAETAGKKCISIETLSPAGKRKYSAHNFTVATGGFYGGGLKASAARVTEPIFNIEIGTRDSDVSADFALRQNFASYGVKIDKDVNPVDERGAKLYDNVYFVGKVVGGADSPYEHSGNGVALATAYNAAMRI